MCGYCLRVSLWPPCDIKNMELLGHMTSCGKMINSYKNLVKFKATGHMDDLGTDERMIVIFTYILINYLAALSSLDSVE